MRVPFIDPLGPMLDPTLPLTVHERDEWGDPAADPHEGEYLRSWAPLENMPTRLESCPHIILTARLGDERAPPLDAIAWAREVRRRGEARVLVQGRWTGWAARFTPAPQLPPPPLLTCTWNCRPRPFSRARGTPRSPM